MDKAARQRWALLLTTLVGTIVAIFYPVDDSAEAPRQSVEMSASKPPVLVVVQAGAPEDDVAESETDPFAPRGWQPEPVATAPTSPAAPIVAAFIGPPAPEPKPPQPPPPPLPFKFVGRLNDNGEQVVYLGLGEQALLARTGETLESTYKVLAINVGQIEFEHLPSGQKQTLVLPVREN